MRTKTWNGLCVAQKHGLDFKGQPCDRCPKSEADVERELLRWKSRANRLRHALLEISGALPLSASELRDIAKDAINFECNQ